MTEIIIGVIVGFILGISIFSVTMSKRWYDARTHLNLGIFISLLCVFRLIDIIRYDFTTDTENVVVTVIVKTHGFRSYTNLKAFAMENISKAKESNPDARYYYQAFIAGHNVAHDFVFGSFS